MFKKSTLGPVMILAGGGVWTGAGFLVCGKIQRIKPNST